MPEELPHVKDQTNTGDISETMSKFIVDLAGKIQQDSDNTAQWRAKMMVALNQRLGVKRYSNYPYEGAPDIPLPETDKLIKKQVPNLVLSAWSPKTLCSVQLQAGYQETPELREKVRKSEAAMNVLLRSKNLCWLKKLYLAADYKKQHGHCLFRVREEFKSRTCTKVIDLSAYDEEIIKTLRKATKPELQQFIAERYEFDLDDEDDIKTIDGIIKQLKSGENVIEFEYEEIESFPNIDVPLPTKVLVPSYTTDITKASRITFEYYLTLDEMERLMDKKIFRKKDLSKLSLAAGEDDIVEMQKTSNEGIQKSVQTQEVFKIHETLCYYREKESDPLQRWCFVRLADSGSPEESLLQDVPFQYEFDGWNWEKCDEEVKDERYYSSRGIPEQVRAYQEIMEKCINNMLIRDELVNNPMWEVLNTSDLLDSHIRFVAGQKLPVRALGQEIQQLGTVANPDMASNAIMQVIKGYVEEYQASSDQLFRNPTNAGGGKTLGEIQIGIQQNTAPLNLEIINWNECLSRVYQKMFDIMKERMGESMYIEDIGEVTNEDFNFPAEVRSNGDLEMANQNMLIQKSFNRVQFLMNPGLQDIVNSEDRYNAVKDWLEKDGVKDPDQFITPPAEIMKSQVEQMKIQIGQMQRQMASMQQGDKMPSRSISFKDLPPEGQSQLAAQAGIQLTPEQFAAHIESQKPQEPEQDIMGLLGGNEDAGA